MLSYAVKATASLTFAIRASAALENMFTSPDRVREYVALEQETAIADRQAPAGVDPSPPLHEEYTGGVIYSQAHYVAGGPVVVGENVVARYAADLPPALDKVSFALMPGKLVGLCGRTGSGKSTMTMMLSRAIHTLEEGRLLLFGRPHTSVPLAEYRRAVQVFPQASFIFSGNLRRYLDPRGAIDDRKLNQVLGDLAHALGDQGDSTGTGTGTGTGQQLTLDLVASAGGANLSAGQKQVVALARAALTDAKVVILDEITSNMDAAAAERAMGIVKRELVARGAAVLLIAHSVNDIAVCDEVWVMDSGHIVETGAPKDLLRNANSIFAFMSSVNTTTNTGTK
jgi:ABC-type multidrug transport system fused ATPase/permease subunit